MKRLISCTVTVIAAVFFLPAVMGGAYGGSASTGLSISTTIVTPNQPPTVTLFANGDPDGASGKAPLVVNFFAEASDPDGVIVQYLWDADGDGNIDQDTGTTPTASIVYKVPGSYNARVTVVDDDGAATTDSVPISAF